MNGISFGFFMNKGSLLRYSFENLLGWLLLYLLVGPFLNQVHHVRLLLSFLLSVALASAIITITWKSRLFGISFFLLALTLGLHWMSVFGIFSFSRYGSLLVMGVYLLVLIFSFFRYIFAARIIDSSLICATLCLYLLLGMLWGNIFALLDILQPGSFTGDLLSQVTNTVDRQRIFQYFSFVTLTTLGYGDILPRTPGATALCQTEAVIGQFFMAVLVARMVGIQVTQQFSCERQEK